MCHPPDLGYNEIRVPSAPAGYTGYGKIQTPHLAAFANEGMLFTDWYSAWHCCSASRAAMLTGRLPPRTGVDSVGGGVFNAEAIGGLPQNESTFATILKQQGYATMAIGKVKIDQSQRAIPCLTNCNVS